ncbi:Zinc/iron permease [Aulographum hederae CBS 113979]|uniref:Zinc/iron permease n=1 Tax=Aulographum hederae CBS 113979 TaxID=1176131 RepID=A0A6G1GQ88_9PEZI|nr:Zinc/iron permease [Aulographum hederae CBS 113979]
MPLDNDTRGWIMSALSGTACIIGASIICVDIIIRQFPGRKNFRIEDSNAFLSSSLSLSCGVMLYSSLYNMLSSATTSLREGGFTTQQAAWLRIGCFLGGALAIQVVSRVAHHFIPHHVVDCDHDHGEEEEPELDPQPQDIGYVGMTQADKNSLQRPSAAKYRASSWFAGLSTQNKPEPEFSPRYGYVQAPGNDDDEEEENSLTRMKSLPVQWSNKVSQLVAKPTRRVCDKNGQCYGYSEPCGQECFKIVQARANQRSGSLPLRQPLQPRSVTTPRLGSLAAEQQPLIQQTVEEELPTIQEQNGYGSCSDSSTLINGHSRTSQTPKEPEETHSHHHDHDHDHHSHHGHHHDEEMGANHHHHVPENAFLSVGLQTSLAIALHKLPEGFITYATNHANPKLGFAVFLALFIHNITEGFAMALPLYLALKSRWKAMFWSSILGGASQPLGAGIAALWFKVAGNGSSAPGEGVYGIMFCLISGIMASVGLQLFLQSSEMTHNRNLCMLFTFGGMGILGISSALTA